MPPDANKLAFRRAWVERLAEVPRENRGLLHRALVVGLLTVSNNALLERDMKALRELWRKRSKKVDSQMLAKQLRLQLNHAERGEGRLPDRLEAAWAKWSPPGADRRDRDPTKKRRSDFGHKHRQKARKIASHLTQADQNALNTSLAAAAAELAVDFD